MLQFLPQLLGGILIGLASGGLYLVSGRIAGITGILRSAGLGPRRGWAFAFIGGILLAALVARLTGIGASSLTAGVEEIPLPILIIAGLLVGVGTDIGNGCTSGHGVCGLSRLSLRSLAAVMAFMGTAGVTLFLVRHGSL